jgi:aryl-alcohol dehydrogenase-like predicted oxidoreductase
MEPPLYTLGATEIKLTPIGLGCWQFAGGVGVFGSYWKALSQEDVNAIVRASLDGGINWFDTAEAYGMGASEAALSRALQAAEAPQSTVIATKWLPFFRSARSIHTTFPRRRERLSPFRITLHQVHHDTILSSKRRQMAAMAELVEQGAIRSVGVSNFSASHMRDAHDALTERGLALASNQVKYSLLDRSIEKNGVLDTARELGVTVIAYSPLEQGILTGKFHEYAEARERLSGPRRFLKWFKQAGLEKSAPLIEALRRIGHAHEATPAQVSLAWTTQRNGEIVVAIPGASSAAQAESNAGAMRVRLTRDEVAELDDASARVAS